MAFEHVKRLSSMFRRPADERVEAEGSRIYVRGFWLFSIGFLIWSWYTFMLSQVAFVNDLELSSDVPQRLDPFLSAWFALVFAFVLVQLCRKGVFSASPFVDEDVFPAEICLWGSLAAGTGMFAFATALRALAELQLLGPSGVNLFHDVVIAAVFGLEIFVLAFIMCLVSFFFSRRRRRALESELDD